MSEPTGHTYTRTHPISGEVLLLDVEAEAKEILDAARTARVGHAAKTLVKQGPLRIVVMGMKQGSAVREHKTEGPASIHVLTGHVSISGGNTSTDLRAGQAMVFDANVVHSLEARADSSLLLTVGWPGA